MRMPRVGGGRKRDGPWQPAAGSHAWIDQTDRQHGSTLRCLSRALAAVSGPRWRRRRRKETGRNATCPVAVGGPRLIRQPR